MSAASVPVVRPDTARDAVSPLRLLYVTHSFAPIGRDLDNVGGMQRTAQDLHAALCRCAGVEVHTLALRTTARLANLQTPGFVAWLARSLPDTVRARAIDVVLFTSLVTAASVVRVGRRLHQMGVPVGSIVHGRVATRRSGVLRWALPRVFAGLDAAFPVSAGTAAACRTRGLASEKITVVPNGVDLSRFREPESRPAARAALLDLMRGVRAGRPDPELIVCGVGRHIERKGFAWFVRDVVPRLPPGIQFWLAGDGPATPTIRREVARAGLHDRVVLLGRLDEPTLSALYEGADLFVMPNVEVPGDFEGFGVVMLEAGASGMPVVAARIEGITDVVRDGETGHLLASGDAEGFASVIAGYAADRDRLAATGRRAASVVRHGFGWEAVARRYVEHLSRLAHAGPAGSGPTGTPA